MLKKIEYNLPRPVAFCTKGAYAEEINAIHDFLASQNETMRLEYDSRRSALNARAMLIRYTKNQPIYIAQRNNYVWIARVDKEAK